MIVAPDGFDWLEEEPVVQEQLATTVYMNDRGEVVIRQKADVYDEGDSIVLLALDNAAVLAHRILETVASRRGRLCALSVYEEVEEVETPASNSNAERQRRHREKKRNAVTQDVTDDRNAPVETQEFPDLLMAAE